MSKLKKTKRDLYYTTSHDWIDFQGSVAYIGVGLLKLKEISQVQQLLFEEKPGFSKQDEVIARLECGNGTVPIHMPVDGKIISINEVLLGGDYQLLIDQPENNGWLALIVPSKPYERAGLMQPEQYKQFARKANGHSL